MSRHYRNVNVVIKGGNRDQNTNRGDPPGCMNHLIIVGILLLLIKCCG